MATNFGASAERRIFEIETGGSAIEAVGGLGVIILSILGLAGVEPVFLASSAGVVFGVALLAQGAAVGTEYTSLFSKVTGGAFSAIELGGGMAVEFVAGGAAIVLGILALVGESPSILLPALVITAGTALILTIGTIQRLNTLKMEAAGASEIAQRVASHAVTGVAGAQFLAGLAAIVLGILAFVPMTKPLSAVPPGPGAWMTFTLVGLLIVGASITMSGGALAGRMMQMFNRVQS